MLMRAHELVQIDCVMWLGRHPETRGRKRALFSACSKKIQTRGALGKRRAITHSRTGTANPGEFHVFRNKMRLAEPWPESRPTGQSKLGRTASGHRCGHPKRARIHV